jgi:MraZ protein
MAISSASLRMWGRFEHSLDDKGRVIVPQKFRDKLGEEFVLTTGPDNHIRVYPMPVWEMLEEQLSGGDVFDEQDESLNFLRRLYGNCEFVSYDQQNLLSIPRYMRDWADLREGETAIIIGNGTRLEVWSRNKWDGLSKEFTAANAAKASMTRKLVESPRPNGNAEAAPEGLVETRGESVPSTP